MKRLKFLLSLVVMVMFSGVLFAQNPSSTINISKIPIATGTPLTQEVCVGLPSTQVVYSTTNSVANTTYAWALKNALPVGVLATEATAGDPSKSPSYTFTNTTGAQVTLTYTITPTGPAPTNCAGSPVDVVIKVNPLPTNTLGVIANVNAGETASLPITTNGTDYKISFSPVVAGLSNIAYTTPIP